MCDTLCVIGAGRTLFAKNSDRPFAEAQVTEWHPRRPPGPTLRTQYLDIPDAGAHALLGSRPTWLWGFEHGVNEHRVAIGNEKVWTTDDPRAAPPALIGMDLVRLGLERSTNADEALDAMTALLEEHGQGGNCEPEHDEPYFSSFLVADPAGAWVLETSGRTWAARRVDDGAAISNRITLGADWTRASADVAAGSDFDRWRDPAALTGIADHRLSATRATVATGAAALGPADLVAAMRHHGEGPWGAPGAVAGEVSAPPADVFDDWSGVTVCMHVRGYQSTAASLVCELPADSDAPLRAWVALGAPCASVYVPVFPPALPAELGDPAEWRRYAALRERVEAHGDALAEVRAVLGPVEADLWEEAEGLVKASPADHTAFTARVYEPVGAALSRLGV